ncbi:MAG TPA: hypothetical protein VM243_01590 [Phycisphaerae bacterium]|nr:hypothetical protein [Phycisphaerae bacterium]
MIPNKRPRRRLVLLAAVWLVLVGTGCDEVRWIAPVMSAAAGWMVGRATTPEQVETTCLRNGVEIDCSTLPQ